MTIYIGYLALEEHTPGCDVKGQVWLKGSTMACTHCGDVVLDGTLTDVSIPTLVAYCAAGVGIWNLPEIDENLHVCGREVGDEEIVALLDAGASQVIL